MAIKMYCKDNLIARTKKAKKTFATDQVILLLKSTNLLISEIKYMQFISEFSPINAFIGENSAN